MSIIDTPPLCCTDCGRVTWSVCVAEGCGEPVCGRCAYRGRCNACAEAAADLGRLVTEYERSLL